MNEKFNSERNVIITAKDEIKSTDVEKYIKENLKTFPQGSQFIVFCGHHHQKNADGSVQIAKSESKIVANYLFLVLMWNFANCNFSYLLFLDQ